MADLFDIAVAKKLSGGGGGGGTYPTFTVKVNKATSENTSLYVEASEASDVKAVILTNDDFYQTGDVQVSVRQAVTEFEVTMFGESLMFYADDYISAVSGSATYDEETGNGYMTGACEITITDWPDEP